jgi:sarcosine oxidase subunit alpha
VIAAESESATPVPMLGHVTSSYLSPNAGRSIAMAMVKNGSRRIGEKLWVSRQDGAPVPVTVAGTDFLAGARASA